MAVLFGHMKSIMDETSDSRAVRARAPLRLGLAGGGSDVSPYCDEYGGFVLNATLNLYAYCTVAQNDKLEADSNHLEVHLLDAGRQCHISLTEPPNEIDPFFRLHWETYRLVCDRFLKGARPALKIYTSSDAPPGSGLGSSSTLVVAMLAALREFFLLPLGEFDLAQLAYHIERKICGQAGGKQDQYAAAFGGFNFIEFYASDRVVVNPLRIKRKVIDELECSLVLFFTGVSRDSSKIIQEQSQVLSTGSSSTGLNAMHLVKAEALEMKELLLKGDIWGLADSLKRGWIAKKQTASSISNSSIDSVVEGALERGARSGKVSGAGGGGFVMLLVDPLKKPNVIRYLDSLGTGYVLRCGFNEHGAQSWVIDT